MILNVRKGNQLEGNAVQGDKEMFHNLQKYIG